MCRLYFSPDENANCFESVATMETVASHVALLLDAKPYEEMYEFCDFSLVDQVQTISIKHIRRVGVVYFDQ